MLISIAIDDEPGALDLIRMHAAKVPFLDLKAVFTNAFEGIEYLQKNSIDLVFLDIKMPDISGIEVVNCLQNPPMIIFTTAYSQYAVEGFELSAVDYLLKPFSLVRFLKACNKALGNKNVNNQEQVSYIFIKTGYQEEKVFLEDILHIEAEGNYLTFVLQGGKQLVSRQTMSEILKVLPEKEFARIHRSYIISIQKVEKIARQEIVIAGKLIPVGISYDEKIAEIRTGFLKSHRQ